MKKLEIFSNNLAILQSIDPYLADNSPIYRMGVITQFNRTFEFAWKALQETMRLHSVEGTETGTPKEMLKLGYKVGFLSDSAVWLSMLKRAAIPVDSYDTESIDETITLIRDSFIPAFSELEKTLEEKCKDAESWS